MHTQLIVLCLCLKVNHHTHDIEVLHQRNIKSDCANSCSLSINIYIFFDACSISMLTQRSVLLSCKLCLQSQYAMSYALLPTPNIYILYLEGAKMLHNHKLTIRKLLICNPFKYSSHNKSV